MRTRKGDTRGRSCGFGLGAGDHGFLGIRLKDHPAVRFLQPQVTPIRRFRSNNCHSGSCSVQSLSSLARSSVEEVKPFKKVADFVAIFPHSTELLTSLLFLPTLNKLLLLGSSHVFAMFESPGKMYALATVLTLLALVAIVLRFHARRMKNAKISWDDYMILPAMVFPNQLATVTWL